MKLENGRYEQDDLDKNSTIWSLSTNDELLEYHQNYSSAKKMTAQEMFEKLGYEYYNQDDEVIVVKEYYRENKYFRQHINFNKIHKNIDVSILDTFLTLEELQAINQQCKELGWL